MALNLRLNRTVSSKNDLIRMYTVIMNLCVMTRISFIGVRIREVFPGSGRVTGIQVDNNYITLPGEVFEDITESGIITVLVFCAISFS